MSHLSPSTTLLRPLRPRLPNTTTTSTTSQQTRHASLLRRPHRPYTFTQLITLSDGSTYTQRTTSPQPVYKAAKDMRNHPLWQPSLNSLRNLEDDEAGRLKAFRARFGRGWDLEIADEEAQAVEVAAAGGGKGAAAKKKTKGREEPRVEAEGGRGKESESLMDLISGFGQEAPVAEKKEAKAKGGKK